MDTIFALATAQGKAGVSVVRISGPLAFLALEKLAKNIPQPRLASVRTLRDAKGIVLDEALVICFEKGASFTGEESVELQLHGSIAIVKAVMAELSNMDGLRVSEPGEFTRRALENERLDLTQVEGLADLIEAETEAQRRQALRVFTGALGEKTEKWRSKLLRAVALIEATIDFADEEVPVDVSPEVIDLINEIMSDLSKEIEGSKVSERIRDGFEVAIIGKPNVGKSTLLNTLAGREAAITSEIAGTTRDVIEVKMDLKGLPVTLLDTAGIRETTDIVEKIGIDRAISRAKNADLRIFITENKNDQFSIEAEPGDVFLIGKDDEEKFETGTSISGKTGYGLDHLIEHISNDLLQRAAHSSTATRQRHKDAMNTALISLNKSLSEISFGPDRAEFAAEELHNSIRTLDGLVGRINIENVLGEIFSSFCIGK